MKRRIFVKLVSVATVSLCLPAVGCRSHDYGFIKTLSQPNVLEHICDAETIREIGKAYQKMAPGEYNKATLEKLIAANIHGQSIDESADRTLVIAALDKKVRQEFQENETIVVNGWVLSVTEARQCALFSLIQN